MSNISVYILKFDNFFFSLELIAIEIAEVPKTIAEIKDVKSKSILYIYILFNIKIIY